MNNCFSRFLFFIIVLSFICCMSCNHSSDSTTKNTIINGNNLAKQIETRQHQYWDNSVQTINAWGDSLTKAKENNDIDLAIASLVYMDSEYNKMTTDIEEFIYHCAYTDNKTEVWEWLKNEHYDEIQKYLKHREELYHH